MKTCVCVDHITENRIEYASRDVCRYEDGEEPDDDDDDDPSCCRHACNILLQSLFTVSSAGQQSSATSCCLSAPLRHNGRLCGGRSHCTRGTHERTDGRTRVRRVRTITACVLISGGKKKKKPNDHTWCAERRGCVKVSRDAERSSCARTRRDYRAKTTTDDDVFKSECDLSPSSLLFFEVDRFELVWSGRTKRATLRDARFFLFSSGRSSPPECDNNII